MQETQNLDNIGPLLVTVARRWRQELDHQLAEAGLSDATWVPLFHLGSSKGPLAQKELAALVGIEGSTLVRLLDSLEERQLVVRQNHPTDRRTRHIVISPAGASLVVKIRKALRRPEAQMLDGLSPAEVASMVKGLAKIQRNLQRLQDVRSAAHAL